MAPRRVVTYSVFKRQVNDAIDSYKSKAFVDKNDDRIQDLKEYRKAVGQAALALKKQKWGGYANDMDAQWISWLEPLQDELKEDWEAIKTISATRVEGLFYKSSGKIQFAYAIHYRMHSEFDYPNFANDIDEGVFGSSYEAEFHRRVFDGGAETLTARFHRPLLPTTHLHGRREFKDVNLHFPSN